MSEKNFLKKLKYHFDKRMARGNASMIRILVTFTVLAAILIAAVITASTPAEDRSFRLSLWDALATAINAWMPYSEEGGAVYLILTALAAVIGLLFTSLLIGIITNAVEEKVDSLKEGNSPVMETGHIVVIGFTPGNFSLIEQLIIMAGEEKQCIVVASPLPRSETEGAIRDNVDIPRNVTVISRTVEPGDVAALKSCSLGTCRTVILDGSTDSEDKKSLLAAHSLLKEEGNADACILEASYDGEIRIPTALAESMRLITIPVGSLVSRLIAHSCAEPGISSVYRDIFQIGGDDLYYDKVPAAVGLTFGEAVRTLWGVVPMGVMTPDRILLNEDYGHVITEEDRLIFWGDASPRFERIEAPAGNLGVFPAELPKHPREKVIIIGRGESLPTVLSSFPEQPTEITVCNAPEEEKESITQCVADRIDLTLGFVSVDFDKKDELLELLKDADHLILLPDSGLDEEEADLKNILRMMIIRSRLESLGRRATVTMELNNEKNLRLVSGDLYTDFIVAPNIVSMALVQLCVRPEIGKILKRLLSNAGSELHIKTPAELGVGDTFNVKRLRSAFLERNMILLGIIENGEIRMNPSRDTVADPAKVESFIVLSER